jgi:hypothetical protein
MAQHFEGDTKKFTLTAFTSFAAVFCILMLFMQCHGDYKASGGGHHAAGASEHHEAAGKGSNHAVKDTSSSTHKNSANSEAHH